MDIRSAVNIVSRYEIYPDLIEDLWFTNDPLWARLRENVKPFEGGTFTKAVFRFRPLIGSFYKMGAVHDITKVQTLGDLNFDMKFAQVSIPEFKEELQVFAKGENTVFSLLDDDIENGLATISDMVSFSAWGEGQSDDSMLNGFAEMIGDGVLPNWNGYVATSYGGQTRNSTYGTTLNANIFWAGQSNGSTGPIEFPILDQAYSAATVGQIEPNLMVMNKAARSYILSKMEAQFRYVISDMNIRDPYWGGSGFRFRNAYVMVSEHAPSALYGKSDADNYGLGNFKTAAFTNVLTGTPSNYFPNSTAAPNLTPGEVIYLFNTDYIDLRISDDPEYGFGFSGFMGTPDSEKVVGRIKFAGNIQGVPKYQSMIYGIGG